MNIRLWLALLLNGAAASDEYKRKFSNESFKSCSDHLDHEEAHKVLNESFSSASDEGGFEEECFTPQFSPRMNDEFDETIELFSTPTKKEEVTEDFPVFKNFAPAEWIQGYDPTTNSEHEKIMKGLKQQIKEFEELVDSPRKKSEEETNKKMTLLQKKIGDQIRNQFQDPTTIKTIEECVEYKTLRSEYKSLCDKLELRALVKELETLVEDQLTFDDPFYFRKSNQEFFGEEWAKMLDRMNEKDRKAIKQKAENILDTKKQDIQRIGELLNKWRVRFKSKWTEITKTSVTAQEFKEFKELNKKYNDLCTRLDKDTKL